MRSVILLALATAVMAQTPLAPSSYTSPADYQYTATPAYASSGEPSVADSPAVVQPIDASEDGSGSGSGLEETPAPDTVESVSVEEVVEYEDYS